MSDHERFQVQRRDTLGRSGGVRDGVGAKAESKPLWEALWTADLHKESRGGGTFQGQEMDDQTRNAMVRMEGGQMWPAKSLVPSECLPSSLFHL